MEEQWVWKYKIKLTDEEDGDIVYGFLIAGSNFSEAALRLEKYFGSEAIEIIYHLEIIQSGDILTAKTEKAWNEIAGMIDFDSDLLEEYI